MATTHPLISPLTLEAASTIVDTALAAGRQRNCQPLTVVVLDAGGHVIVAKREDGSGILRFDIAFGKAWGALGMGRDSRDLGKAATQSPVFASAVSNASGGRYVPVAGGVLLIEAGGTVIGAVGISGDASDVDEACAIEGIKAAGLVSIPESAAPPAG